MIERDAALVQSFRTTRDSSVFDKLYRDHTPSLYATAVRITSDPTIAADAVHDTWLRCIERLDAFDGRSSFRTWSTGILINCIRESWRRARREPDAIVTDHVTNGTPPLPHNIDPLDLESAISSLPSGFREVLILHDVEGFSHDEIGEMLGIASGTSKSQLSRARQKLRAKLGDE